MLYKLVNRLTYLDTLIRKQSTGTPGELAKRLGLTERAWYKVRDELVNDLGVPLAYDPQRQTYYYTKEGQFRFGFCRSMTSNDMEKLEGGRSVLPQSSYAEVDQIVLPKVPTPFSFKSSANLSVL